MWGRKKTALQKNGMKTETSFKYPEVVYNHYRYRDCINNHNSQRMHPISMEETWMTTQWPNWVFWVLLVVTMVNMQNAANYFANTIKMDSLSATSHCTTAHIQQTSVHRNDTNKAQKSSSQLSTASSWSQSSKKIYSRVTGHPVRPKYGKWKCTRL